MRATIALLALLVAGNAYAEDAFEEARREFVRGVQLLDDARFADAARAFERSIELRDSPVARYNLGLAYRGTGAYQKALVSFRLYLERAGADAKPPKAEVEKIVRDLEGALGTLSLHLDGAPDAAAVDGEAIDPRPAQELRLDPGRHVARASKKGHRDVSAAFELREGATLELRLDAAKDPLPAPPPVAVAPAPAAPPREEEHLVEKWWFWGGAVLVVAAVAGGVAIAAGAGSSDPPYDGGSLGFTIEALRR